MSRRLRRANSNHFPDGTSPADGLQLFVTDLMKAGLTNDQITTMGREVTGKLLMG